MRSTPVIWAMIQRHRVAQNRCFLFQVDRPPWHWEIYTDEVGWHAYGHGPRAVTAFGLNEDALRTRMLKLEAATSTASLWITP